jgi:hypothetical protein
MMKHMTKLLILITIICFWHNSAFSEENGEPILENLRKTFQKDYLSIGIVLQTVGDFQIERSFPGYSGFNISNFRFRMYGELDNNFGYFVMANFINVPAVLDAKAYYKFSKGLIVDAGLFKTTFSKEFLTPAESIDFVNRSRVVSVLVPGRQIGVQARGWLLEDFPIWYGLGVFNGNGFGTNSNDNNNFLYSSRIAAHPFKPNKNSTKQLEIGINAAYSKDDFARISALLNPFVFDALFFEGKRTIYGGDIRLTLNKILIAAEYIMADFDGMFTSIASDDTVSALKPSGYHLTAGYMLAPKIQLLGRLDSFKTDKNKESSNWVLLGLNIWPTQVTELQFNYTINTDNSEFKYHQLLINGQVAF